MDKAPVFTFYQIWDKTAGISDAIINSQIKPLLEKQRDADHIYYTTPRWQDRPDKRKNKRKNK